MVQVGGRAEVVELRLAEGVVPFEAHNLLVAGVVLEALTTTGFSDRGLVETVVTRGKAQQREAATALRVSVEHSPLRASRPVRLPWASVILGRLDTELVDARRP